MKQLPKEIKQMVEAFDKMDQDCGRVGGVAGFNAPQGKPIRRQNKAGEFPEMSQQVASQSGQGIAKKGRERTFEKQPIAMAQRPRPVQFTGQGQTFVLDDPDTLQDEYYGEPSELDFSKMGEFPGREEMGMEDQFGFEKMTPQERRHRQELMKDDQLLRDQKTDQVFAQRRSQLFGQYMPQNVPTAKPKPSEQRTQHTGSQQRQRDWSVPQSTKTDKQVIKQGADFQELYDNMDQFMIDRPGQMPDLTSRNIGGVDPGYDVA